MPRQVIGNVWHAIRWFFQRANAIIESIAQPSFTQFGLRIGLATPFWRSGINKWDGFLQLNDVAVLLFRTEFKLHLPGSSAFSAAAHSQPTAPSVSQGCDVRRADDHPTP